jgi:single-stranded DNA-binding protein
MLGGKATGGGSFEVMDKPAASSEQSSAAPASASKRPAPAKSNFDNFDDDIPF